ncbi:zinc-binding dehydrogenase [Kiritimatiellaeota bacterium B1221]|nr:zinc-binding dehydrogenase [Kiritimatiellaeota bacterium B1221]
MKYQSKGLKVYGLLPDLPDYHFNGYFGDDVVIRPGSTFFGVNEMSIELRTLIEPAAVVCHALERAKQCGSTLNFRSRVAGAVAALTKGVGAHFASQVTGVPAAFSNFFKMVRRGGGVYEVGDFVDGGECKMNPYDDVCRKEITLVGRRVYNSFEYPNAYHFLQRAERMGLPVHQLITHRFPLSQIDEAFSTSLRQEGVEIMVENEA